MRVVKLPGAVAAIYKAVEELDRIYAGSGRKFTPDGHLVGSIGEVIAAEELGLELLPPSAKDHDATDPKTGRRVQIKMTATNRVSLYANCDRLVVLRVLNPGEAEIVYDGDGEPVWEMIKNRRQKNSQHSISLKALRGLISN